jgi:hypothetical protein
MNEEAVLIMAGYFFVLFFKCFKNRVHAWLFTRTGLWSLRTDMITAGAGAVPVSDDRT